MPLENDFTRVFGAIKELEERVERMEGKSPGVYASKAIQTGQAMGPIPPLWTGLEPDYKSLHEGECPVGEGVKVDVLLRIGGGILTGSHWKWEHHGGGRDIIAYRIAR